LFAANSLFEVIIVFVCAIPTRGSTNRKKINFFILTVFE
jgi:hypothetical protein